MISASNRNGSARGDSFKAHRDAFFFLLQRELEKVSVTLSQVLPDTRSTSSTSSRSASSASAS
jgi:hypothetical protein